MTGMSQQTVAILLLAMLLLPTVGALLGRLLGRWLGPRALAAVATLGFLAALGSAVALHQSELDRSTLGSLAIFVPAEGPLIDAGAFSLARPPSGGVDEPQVALLETAPAGTSNTAEAAISVTAAAQSTEVAALEPTLPPSPTSASTDAPTAIPTTTPTATALPEPTATSEPTAIPTPLPEPTTAPVAAPEPTQEPTERPTATSQPSAPTSAPQESEVYFVREGDTLRGIAERFGISVDALLRYNGLSTAEGDQLQLDQRLLVPPVLAAAPQATRRPAPQPQAYIVEQGDTLRGIAERFGISVDALLRYNGLSAAEGDQLRPDQRLFIPPS